MGFIATDIATIPSQGFEWYVFVLLDDWSDSFRDELERNFDRLVSAVGKDCLVVRGAKPKEFYNQVLDSQLMRSAATRYGRPPLPALIVSNRTLGSMNEHTGEKSMDDARVMIFPLAQRYVRPGSITSFLQRLAENIKNKSFDEIEKDEHEESLKSRWRWITEYMELKPTFFGFGVNLNKILENVFQERDHS